MVDKKRMAFFLGGGTFVGLALGGLLCAPGQASVIPTNIPQAVVALIEDRCLPFLKTIVLPPRRFDGRGLTPVFSGYEHIDRYTVLDGKITVDPKKTQEGPICSVSNEFSAWGRSDIESVVQYAMTLGSEWSGQDAIRLDVSSNEVPFQIVFRPPAGHGKFLTVSTAPVEGNRSYVNVTIGWSDFEEHVDA